MKGQRYNISASWSNIIPEENWRYAEEHIRFNFGLIRIEIFVSIFAVENEELFSAFLLNHSDNIVDIRKDE